MIVISFHFIALYDLFYSPLRLYIIFNILFLYYFNTPRYCGIANNHFYRHSRRSTVNTQCMRFSFLLLVSILLTMTSASSIAVAIVAHRGASTDAPENTLPAFELAWEQGADVIEGDFHLTEDNAIVCFHDKTTARIAGVNLVVASTPYAQLEILDVGAWKDPKWKGTTIPTLTEVIGTLPHDKGRVFIEIKDTQRIVQPLADTINNLHLPKNRLAILCFDADIITACKKAMPSVEAHWLVNSKTYQKTGTAGLIRKLKEMGADGVDIQASRQVTPELGIALQEHGLQFHCWTVNDIPLAQHMVAMGAESITTDKPELLRKSLPLD